MMLTRIGSSLRRYFGTGLEDGQSAVPTHTLHGIVEYLNKRGTIIVFSPSSGILL
jgi:hypothetical protein